MAEVTESRPTVTPVEPGADGSDPARGSGPADGTGATDGSTPAGGAGTAHGTSTADGSAPADGAHAADGPVDPRSIRVDVRTAMGVDAGPWTVGPDGVHDVGVRWVDGGRAVVVHNGSPDEDGTPVLVGDLAGPSRTGPRRTEVVVGGWRVLLDVEPERLARLRERARRGGTDAARSGPLEVRAIIPGRVVAVSVAEGDEVEAGQQLLVVEAMKMQNELRSPRAGIVERIAVGPGQNVELAALLLVLR